MRIVVLLLSASFVYTSSIVYAAKDSIDCSRDSLADAVSGLKDKDKDLTIQFTGVCVGPVVVHTDGLTLKGVGTAVIDGGHQDALTVAGAGRVSLLDFEVRNGANGIVAANGAHVTLNSVSSHDNLVFGLTLQTGSSATLTDVTLNNNGVHGLDIETGSSATATGSLTASSNGVFGINVNASSLTISHGTVTANGNTLGIQIATNGNAFIGDTTSSVTASDNHTVGLTGVSGAHMVSFGGAITVSGNPIAGVSLNSKAGLDLDAAAVLTSAGNGDGVLMQEASVMTVFNTPAFSGSNGSSTVDAHGNTGSGLRVQTGSTLTLANLAAVKSSQNGGVGLIADNGVALTLVHSTLTGNGAKDLQMTFGTRADLQTTTLATYTCDATVLVRGTSGLTCPH